MCAGVGCVAFVAVGWVGAVCWGGISEIMDYNTGYNHCCIDIKTRIRKAKGSDK